MKQKNYTISDITEIELKELEEKTGGTKSELVRRAIHELWAREVKNNE